MPDNKNRELAKVLKVLNENQQMNFVQRILKPHEWPVLRDKEAGEGNWASHAMVR